MTHTRHTGTTARLLRALLLAVASSAVWFAWIGRDLNPEPWRILGAVLTGAMLVLAASRYLPSALVVVPAPLGFTLACAVAIYPQDETGMSLIGIILVGFVSLVAVVALVGLSALIDPKNRRLDPS